MSSNLYAYILRMPRSDISLIKAYASGTALLELTDRLDEVERDKIVVATARLVKEVKKDLAFSTPWGKHSLYLFPDGKLVLKSSKAEIVVPCSALKQVAIIDVPKDPKKTVLIFLVLDKPVEATGGGKSIDNIVLKVSGNTNMTVKMAGGEVLDNLQPLVICSILGKAGVRGEAFVAPDDLSVYSNTKGGPSLEVAFKANQGHLFPMAGVLFFIERPGLCIPHRDIASYEVLRAESSFSSSELVLYMKPGRGAYERYEFTFSRPELGKLLTYLEQAKLKKYAKEEKQQAKGKSTAAAEPEAETAEGADADEGPRGKRARDASDVAGPSSSEKGKRGRKQQQPGEEEEQPAADPDDDDDDDEDFVGDESEEDEDDGGDEEEESQGTGSEDGSDDGSDGGSSGDDSGSDSGAELVDEEDVPAAAIKGSGKRGKTASKR